MTRCPTANARSPLPGPTTSPIPLCHWCVQRKKDVAFRSPLTNSQITANVMSDSIDHRLGMPHTTLSTRRAHSFFGMFDAGQARHLNESAIDATSKLAV
jgi:hypothetical protein